MLIKVCRSGKRRQSVSVPDNATVSALKSVIEHQQRIPIAEQNLTFNGLFLEDGKLISDYGLYDNCTILLYLRLGYKPDYTITVLLPAKKKINLDVASECTVAELKRQIEALIGVKLGSAELIYDHWLLEDNRKLMEYDISEGATIVLAHELRDGPGLGLRDSLNVKYARPSAPPSSSSHASHRKLKTTGQESSSTESEEEEDNDRISVVFLPKTGPPMALRLVPATLIGEARSKLAHVLNVSPNSIWFVRNGKTLDPSKSFAHYGISHGESVCLMSDLKITPGIRSLNSSTEDIAERKIRIIVQTKSGHTVACHVRGSTIIGDLKRRLEREMGVPSSQMTIFYQRKMLRDDTKMRDYDLGDGALLYLR